MGHPAAKGWALGSMGTPAHPKMEDGYWCLGGSGLAGALSDADRVAVDGAEPDAAAPDVADDEPVADVPVTGVAEPGEEAAGGTAGAGAVAVFATGRPAGVTGMVRICTVLGSSRSLR